MRGKRRRVPHPKKPASSWRARVFRLTVAWPGPCRCQPPPCTSRNKRRDSSAAGRGEGEWVGVGSSLSWLNEMRLKSFGRLYVTPFHRGPLHLLKRRRWESKADGHSSGLFRSLGRRKGADNVANPQRFTRKSARKSVTFMRVPYTCKIPVPMKTESSPPRKENQILLYCCSSI